MSEKLLCVRDAAHFLGISEKEVIELGERGIIPCYKVGGEFFRFKKQDILSIKDEIRRMFNVRERRFSFREMAADFMYFNSFYIVSCALIIVLLWFVFFTE